MFFLAESLATSEIKPLAPSSFVCPCRFRLTFRIGLSHSLPFEHPPTSPTPAPQEPPAPQKPYGLPPYAFCRLCKPTSMGFLGKPAETGLGGLNSCLTRFGHKDREFWRSCLFLRCLLEHVAGGNGNTVPDSKLGCPQILAKTFTSRRNGNPTKHQQAKKHLSAGWLGATQTTSGPPVSCAGFAASPRSADLPILRGAAIAALVPSWSGSSISPWTPSRFRFGAAFPFKPHIVRGSKKIPEDPPEEKKQ